MLSRVSYTGRVCCATVAILHWALRRSPRGYAGAIRPALLGIVLAVALTGCAETKSSLRQATLVLDFTPNAVHAGIYSALRRGYDRKEGVELHVEQPSESTDSVKLLLAGSTNFAILDIHDLAIARSQGQDIVGVLALVQKPLAAVIAGPSIANPRQLQGRTVGVTGLSSDEAVLRSVLAGAGGDPKRVRHVNIGFQAVPSLLARRVSAVTAFWDVEGVELAHARPGVHEFRVDEFGAPSYPELIVCVTGSEIRDHPALVRHVVHAIQRGYAVSISDPAASVDDLLAEVPGLDHSQLSEQMAALRGAFLGPFSRFGELDRSHLRLWATWEARFGIVARAPDVNAMFDPSFAG
jgi:ABC-type nitrate/sulfonate/bicarbonate transport system substrate-binding protein